MVQERLNEAGYKTEVRFSTNELVDGDNFLCISFYSVWIRGVPLNTRIEYNKKNSKSKKMARVLRRYLDKQGVGPSELWPCDDSGVTTIVNDEEGDVEVPTDYPKMLFQDVPSVSIGLARAKIHELKEEYAVAILKAVNNYLD